MFQARPHYRTILALANHGLVARHPMRSQSAQVAERLDEIGLALSVASHEQVGSGREVDLDGRIIAKIGEPEMNDSHRPSENSGSTHRISRWPS